MVSPKPLIRNQTFKHTLNQFMKVRSFHAHIVNTEQNEKVIFRHTSNPFMRVKSFHVHNVYKSNTMQSNTKWKIAYLCHT